MTRTCAQCEDEVEIGHISCIVCNDPTCEGMRCGDWCDDCGEWACADCSNANDDADVICNNCSE